MSPTGNFMTGAKQQRRYPRVDAGAFVSFRREDDAKAPRYYRKGLIKDISLGGMFITTEHLFRRGSLLSLKYDPAAPPMTAKAVVRWTRRFSRPRGMGVEFVEFEKAGKEEWETWIARVSRDQAVE